MVEYLFISLLPSFKFLAFFFFTPTSRSGWFYRHVMVVKRCHHHLYITEWTSLSNEILFMKFFFNSSWTKRNRNSTMHCVMLTRYIFCCLYVLTNQSRTRSLLLRQTFFYTYRILGHCKKNFFRVFILLLQTMTPSFRSQCKKPAISVVNAVNSNLVVFCAEYLQLFEILENLENKPLGP